MCGQGFVARTADASDLDGIARLAREVGADAPVGPDLDAARAGRGQLDVAVSGGDVVGFLLTGAPDEQGRATLSGPFVGVSGVGLGVERALVRRAIEGAQGRGVGALRALVPAGEPVRLGLFAAQGFVRVPDADLGGRLTLVRGLR